MARYDFRLYTIVMLLFSLAAVPFVRMYQSVREKLFEQGYAPKTVQE